MKFKFVIKPSSICDPNILERPDLEGVRKQDVPGANQVHSTDPKNGPGDHAAKKWDVSRQMQIRIRNPNSIPKASLVQSGPSWFANQPLAVDTPVPFPTNPAEGNDDFSIPTQIDEDDIPYQKRDNQDALDHQVGEITSIDSPEFPVLNNWGATGRHFGTEANFREFCRLEINDGRRTSGTFWYRISDYYEWHHYLSTDYNGTTNVWDDAGSSSDTGHPIP